MHVGGARPMPVSEQSDVAPAGVAAYCVCPAGLHLPADERADLHEPELPAPWAADDRMIALMAAGESARL